MSCNNSKNSTKGFAGGSVIIYQHDVFPSFAHMKRRLVIFGVVLNLLTWAAGLKAVDTNAQDQAALDSPPFNAPQYDWVLAMHQRGRAAWPGNTNALFLKTSWFLGPQEVFFFDLFTDGRMNGGLSTPFAVHGGGGGTLDKTNLTELATLIAQLPPPPTVQPPKERWLLVSGRNNNRWFTSIYDRADLPLAVDQLFAITREPLQWALPNVSSTTNIAGAPGRSVMRHTVLWNLQKLQEVTLPQITASNGWNTLNLACALSADGRWAVVSAVGPGGADGPGHQDNDVYALDCASGKIRWQKWTHTSPVARQLACAAADKVLVVALEDSTLEEWNLATGEKLDSLAGTPPGIEAMTASRNGRYLATCSRDGSLRVWDLQTKGPPKILADSTWLSVLEFSPDGRYLAVAGWNYQNAFGIWDWAAGKKLLTRHYWNGSSPEPATGLAWSPDGKRLAVQPGRQQVVIFDARSWKALAGWGPGWVSGGPQLRLAFAADGALTAQTDDGSLQILDVPALERLE
jgi:hypothetical protein